MNTRNVLKQVLNLDPAERHEVAEQTLRSLDQADPVIDAIARPASQTGLSGRA
jgi:hypothetical protein